MYTSTQFGFLIAGHVLGRHAAIVFYLLSLRPDSVASSNLNGA